MSWFFSINKESFKEKIMLALRMCGSAILGLLIAFFIVILFSHAIPEDLFINSNCDTKCSRVLALSGFFMFLPFVFVPSWATFTYIFEIIFQKKMKDVPRRVVGVMPILILLLGSFISYDIVHGDDLSALSMKAIEEWRAGTLTNETIESFEASVQKFLKTRAPANLNKTSEE